MNEVFMELKKICPVCFYDKEEEIIWDTDSGDGNMQTPRR